MVWSDWVSGVVLAGMGLYVAAQFYLNLNRRRSKVGAAKPTAGDAATYQQAGESMRHYATLRFSQLTVLMAFATVVAGALTLTPLPADRAGWLRVTAMGTTFAFLVMQERAVDHWKQAHRAASAVEAHWGTSMFSGWKEIQALSATNATRAVHLLLGLLWLVLR